MRQTSLLKVLLGMATLFPLCLQLVPLAALPVISLGLWDGIDGFLSARAPTLPLESIGWNAALAMGALLLALHHLLVVFYTIHIITNHSTPIAVRLSFALALLVLPFITMTAYYFIYILPPIPPDWAKPPHREQTSASLSEPGAAIEPPDGTPSSRARTGPRS
jgi:hypothetical protein